MKKVSLMTLAVLILVGMLSTSLVSAQDEAPACSPEQVGAAMEALAEVDFESMTTLPEEPTTSDFSAMVLTLDSFAYGYWEGFYEGMEAGDTCAEVIYLGTNSGYVFDELLIVSLLSSLAVHEEAAGDSDTAAVFLEQAEARQASLEAGMEGMVTNIEAFQAGEEIELDVVLPECTEEEVTAATEGMTEVAGFYEELAGALEGATGTDLSALVAGFAELSAGYWEEFMPELPACQEVYDFAFTTGLVMDETVIVTGLLRLAELEAEAGDADLAEALAESATVRAEELEAAIEELFAEEE
jgi:hypothetical protein